MHDPGGDEQAKSEDPLGDLGDDELVERLRTGFDDRSWTVAELISLEHRGYEILDGEPELRRAIEETVQLTWSRVQESIRPLAENVADQVRAVSASPGFHRIADDLTHQILVLNELPALKALADDMRASIAAASGADARPVAYPSATTAGGAMNLWTLADERIDSADVLAAAIQEHTIVLLRIESNTSDAADAAAVSIEHAVAESGEARNDVRLSRRISWLSLAASTGALVIAVVALIVS